MADLEAILLKLTELDNKVDTMNNKMDNKMDTLNNKIDKMNNTLNIKIDTMTNKLNNKMDKMNNTLNYKIDTMNNTLNHRMDVNFWNLSRQLNSAINPAILFEFNQLRVLSSCGSDYTDAVLLGKQSTWTIMKYGNSILAVGCLHCGFQKATARTTIGSNEILFAGGLPEAVLDAGVKKVWLKKVDVMQLENEKHKSSLTLIRHPLPPEMDVMMVELENLPVGVDRESLPTYGYFSKEIAGDLKKKKNTSCRVLGRGVSGMVHGSNLVPSRSWRGHDAPQVFTFLLEKGEPGDSGTLMFAEFFFESKLETGASVVPEIKYFPLGVFRGIAPTQRSMMQKRGVINALAPSGNDDVERMSVVTTMPQSLESLQLIGRDHSKTSYRASQPQGVGEAKGKTTLTDLETDEKIYGVLIESLVPIHFCGEAEYATMYGISTPAPLT